MRSCDGAIAGGDGESSSAPLTVMSLRQHLYQLLLCDWRRQTAAGGPASVSASGRLGRRGHGQVAGLWIRASARFCAAYQDQVKTRLGPKVQWQ